MYSKNTGVFKQFLERIGQTAKFLRTLTEKPKQKAVKSVFPLTAAASEASPAKASRTIIPHFHVHSFEENWLKGVVRPGSSSCYGLTGDSVSAHEWSEKIR